MKEFQYTVTDPLGIHARPAGMLAQTARGFGDTVVTITKGGSTVRASQLMRLMGMGVKQGDTVTVTADGPTEEKAIAAIRKLFEENL